MSQSVTCEGLINNPLIAKKTFEDLGYADVNWRADSYSGKSHLSVYGHGGTTRRYASILCSWDSADTSQSGTVRGFEMTAAELNRFKQVYAKNTVENYALSIGANFSFVELPSGEFECDITGIDPSLAQEAI